jgi:hypothetical protein
MISHFKFTHIHDPKSFKRELSGILTPIIEGQYEKGGQLPLKITPVERD